VRALRRLLAGPQVALLHRFHRPPYGGGNQFLLALRKELRRAGVDVGGPRIGPRTRACLLNSYNFDEHWLEALRGATCRRVHRIDGPISVYRGRDDGIDARIAAWNAELADATVLQSEYSLAAHRALGLALRAPVVIPNAVDPEIFHARGRASWDGERRFRVVATSWSDNPNKGGATLQALERQLDPSRFELTFVGRTGVAFTRVRVHAPLASEPLAALLRQQDAYVAPSIHDPCSNALLEALACGLPAAFARSGGHPEIVGQGGVGFDAPDEAAAAVEALAARYDACQAAIRVPALADVAARYAAVLGVSGPLRPGTVSG
jgi:glycosyltransferase involved in cell wall biosynthesis